MAGYDLFCWPSLVDPKPRGVRRARAVRLSRGLEALRDDAAAGPAGFARGAVLGRNLFLLLGGLLPAACRRDDILSRGPDFCHRDIAFPPRRDDRLETMGGGDRGFRRRCDRDAAFV